ncbi:MAG TPA: hypothetical protein VH415_10710 [Nitrososphaeraceae archaeon]|jgi:hypothetical protein
MGRTIPSFRIAAERERATWRDFRSKLATMKVKKEFEQMFSLVRLYNSNCMMQASPIVFHSVMMSILFHHYKQLMKLKGMNNILLPLTQNPELLQNPSETLDRYCHDLDSNEEPVTNESFFRFA